MGNGLPTYAMHINRTFTNDDNGRVVYEVLDGLCVYRYFKLGSLARRATAHLAQLADQHESHQAASQAFRKVPSLGLWPVTSGLKVILGYFSVVPQTHVGL